MHHYYGFIFPMNMPLPGTSNLTLSFFLTCCLGHEVISTEHAHMWAISLNYWANAAQVLSINSLQATVSHWPTFTGTLSHMVLGCLILCQTPRHRAVDLSAVYGSELCTINPWLGWIPGGAISRENTSVKWCFDVVNIDWKGSARWVKGNKHTFISLFVWDRE